MARRANDSARILNFFIESSLDKAEVVYDLVRDVMAKRFKTERTAVAPKRRKAKAAPVTGETLSTYAEYAAREDLGGAEF